MRSNVPRRGLTVSVVVPVFDEEDTVGLFVAAVAPALARVRELLGPDGRTEILFVDDGSRDGTADAVLSQEAAGTAIRLLRLSRNFGKDSALSAGLDHARGDAVVPMDVDLQDPPDVLVPMVEAWLAGAKVVNAVRDARHEDTWLKKTSAGVFYRLYNVLAKPPIEPNVGDYRLLDRSVVDTISRMPERVRFMKGLFSWVGYRSASVSYSRPARVAGSTKWKLWSLWNFAIDGITSSTTFPLRIWTYVGTGLAAVSLLYAAYTVLKTLILGVDVPGYASILAVVLVIGAFNFIAIGIIGEYIGRISIEVRGRPLYVVEAIETARNGPQDGAAEGAATVRPALATMAPMERAALERAGRPRKDDAS